MELRTLTAASLLMLVLSSARASADESITLRPGLRDRWIIEDSTGRQIGTVRPLSDHTLVIESPEGHDIGTIRRDRDGFVDIDELCGNDRAPLSCLLDDDE
jgi:hypothetical protein